MPAPTRPPRPSREELKGTTRRYRGVTRPRTYSHAPQVMIKSQGLLAEPDTALEIPVPLQS